MSSYRQIFKSTAVVGGAQVLTSVVGMLRQKATTVLLGAEGYGLVGLFSIAISLIGVITGLGIGMSGVRQIAESSGSGDQEKLARTVRTLRLVSLACGIVGMLVTVCFCRQLSWATFHTYEYASGFVLVSLTLLFLGVSTGQIALLQGLRRIREMASAQVLGAVLGSIAGVLVLYLMRERGVVWFLVAVSAATPLASWWFARRVKVGKPHMTAKDFATEGRGLLGMGVAMMTASLVANGKDYLTRVWIHHDLSLVSVGLYVASWNMSSQYVGLILGAMQADFAPRLTAVQKDHPQVNRLVNEQMELGVLLALPGVVATLVFAPWILHLFNSKDFVAAADLMRWLMIGNFLRVVAWPLGMIVIAKGASRLFVILEVVMGVLSLGLILLGMKWWNLEGVGIAFAALYVASYLVNWVICRRLTGYTISSRGEKIIGGASVIVIVGFLLTRLTNPVWSIGAGTALTVVASVASYVGVRKLLQIDPWDALMRKLGVRKAA